jgi:ELWxxDGT repeat protein
MVAFDGDLVVANDGIWRTDGTPAGTRQLESGYAWYLTASGSTLFFVRDRALWASDRTPGGAHSLGEPGLSEGLRDLFAADDGVHGQDLWRSDGTAEGTTMVADLDVAPLGQLFDLFSTSDRLFFSMTGECPCGWETDGTVEVGQFTWAGDHIFFTANVGGAGAELWALPVDALPEVCVDCFDPTPTEVPPPATPTPTPDCGDGCTVVTLSEGSGAPGDVTTIAAHLTAEREPIAGVELDLYPAPGLRLAATTAGDPDREADPESGKEAAFAFRPGGCVPGVDCMGVHALVLSLTDVDAIPNGARLFECRVAIARGARPGRYPVTAAMPGASDPDGNDVAVHATDGAVTVLRSSVRAQSSGDASGCHIAYVSDGRAWMLLLAPLLARVMRRSAAIHFVAPSPSPVRLP